MTEFASLIPLPPSLKPSLIFSLIPFVINDIQISELVDYPMMVFRLCNLLAVCYVTSLLVVTKRLANVANGKLILPRVALDSRLINRHFGFLLVTWVGTFFTSILYG